MDTSTTLKEQIQALMDSLADTALSAAESCHQSQAGEAHLLYALYRNDGLVGSILRGHGLESSEIRLLMSDIPNRPLKMGEDPVLSSSSRHILHDAHDAVEVLRQVQRDSHVELLLRAHGIELPEHQPTREQVEAASRTGVNLAQTVSPNRGRQVGCQLSRFRRGWHGGSRRPCSFPLIGKQRHRSDLFLRFSRHRNPSWHMGCELLPDLDGGFP